MCVTPSTGCTAAEEYQAAVMRSFGWKVNVVFPAGSPQGWQSAMNAAIAEHVDAISAISISPSAVSQQLKEAHKDGIITVDTAQSKEIDGPGYDAYVDFRHALLAQLLAEYAMVQTKGNAHIVNISIAGIPDLNVKNVQNLVTTTCPRCSYKTVTMTLAAITDPVQTASQITAILDTNPNLNYIIFPTDNVQFNAALEAIRAAGKANTVKLITQDGNPPGMTAVQQGTSAVYGLMPYQWALGVSGVDALLREFHHSIIPTASGYGLGAHLVTKANAPKGTITYKSIACYSLGFFNWVGAYSKAWHVKIPSPC
jgi:ABC-type sugar transport system substrate-binding protein